MHNIYLNNLLILLLLHIGKKQVHPSLLWNKMFPALCSAVTPQGTHFGHMFKYSRSSIIVNALPLRTERCLLVMHSYTWIMSSQFWNKSEQGDCGQTCSTFSHSLRLQFSACCIKKCSYTLHYIHTQHIGSCAFVPIPKDFIRAHCLFVSRVRCHVQGLLQQRPWCNDSKIIHMYAGNSNVATCHF